MLFLLQRIFNEDDSLNTCNNSMSGSYHQTGIFKVYPEENIKLTFSILFGKYGFRSNDFAVSKPQPGV